MKRTRGRLCSRHAFIATSRPQAFTRTRATCINKTNCPLTCFESSQSFAPTFTPQINQPVRSVPNSYVHLEPRAYATSGHSLLDWQPLSAFFPHSAADINHHDACSSSRPPHWHCLDSLWSCSESTSAATRHKRVSTSY